MIARRRARVRPDIGEPPLLLQRLHSAFVQRALVWEQPLLPARQEHRVELQPLRAVQRHQADPVAFGCFVVLHHQRYMVEEAGQRFEIGQRANQFLQVFEPSRCFGRFVLLPHVGVAALVEQVATVTTWPSLSSSARQRAKPRSSASSCSLTRPFSPPLRDQLRRRFHQRHAIRSRASRASRAAPHRQRRAAAR